MIIKRQFGKYGIKPDLFSYIVTNILPEYSQFDGGHNIDDHVVEVIDNILKLSKYYNVNKNMLFVIGSYHDLGLSKGRDKHEYYSKLRLLSDSKLKKWFTDNEIKVMSEAVEDHRATNQEVFFEAESIQNYRKID